MKDVSIKKLYYSISEVSEMASVKPYVLRYWESEFFELRPSKNRAGNRIYRKHDIQTVLLIKKLLYLDKFTIEGARQRLRNMQQNTSDVSDAKGGKELRGEVLLGIIDEFRGHLRELLSIIGDGSNSN